MIRSSAGWKATAAAAQTILPWSCLNRASAARVCLGGRLAITTTTTSCPTMRTRMVATLARRVSTSSVATTTGARGVRPAALVRIRRAPGILSRDSGEDGLVVLWRIGTTTQISFPRMMHTCTTRTRVCATLSNSTQQRSMLFRKNYRFFSNNAEATTTAAAATTTSETKTSRAWEFWRRLAWWVRTLRIPVLVFSVFGLGYQQGIIECTKHPQALQQQILRGMLADHGVVDLDEQVDILLESEISYLNPHRHHQVAAVGHRIVSSARTLVQQELEQAMQNVLETLPHTLTPEQAEHRINHDAKVQYWYHAALRLYGEVNSSSLVLNALNMAMDAVENPKTTAASFPAKLQQQMRQAKLVQVPWQYVFVQSAQPNAFVSEVLPQRFFITTAMLDIATTPDELALVLGHEISHLILGHVSQSNQVETLLRTVEVLLLSVDPTSGFLSLLVVGALATLRSALSAAHSREHEREADDLGLRITARACYNTVAGAEVMYKMHQADVSLAPSSSSDASDEAPVRPWNLPKAHNRRPPLQLLDTHPPTLERYERLKQEALDGENYTKYQKDLCATMSSRLYAALGWGVDSKKGRQQ
ncbi:hypothetical protein ACA910_002101 [Epithemia clementina (nom. ined.)]